MLLALILVAQCAAAIGNFVSSIFSSMETASIVAPLFAMPMVLFGGFFANGSNYPAYINWLQYVSPIRYGFEMMVRAQLSTDKEELEIMTKFLG
jgi:ABC-type multidrug transport system permease subunit